MGQEFELQPSPSRRQARAVFATGVEQGWTPKFTFQTPGDLVVGYQIQEGTYLRDLNTVRLTWYLAASTFTYSSATGALQITNVPFAAKAPVTGGVYFGSMAYSGFNSAGGTQIAPAIVGGTSTLQFYASGAGVAFRAITFGDVSSDAVGSTGVVQSVGTLEYLLGI